MLQHEHDLIEKVCESFNNSKSERYKELMQCIVTKIHEFIIETGLTEREWEEGINFLTRVGKKCTEKRQEFILLSDTLGASMQMVNINNPKEKGITESTVFGPFFTENAPKYALGDDITNGAKGRPCFIKGTVKNKNSDAVQGARINVWESDEDGFYDSQYDYLNEMRNRGQIESNKKGEFWFWGVLPTAYPIPYDGPVGDMLKAANRSPMRPAHLHFMIVAEGYKKLVTHIFVRDKSKAALNDAVFGVKESLIIDFNINEPGKAPDGKVLEKSYYSMEYDFVLKNN